MKVKFFSRISQVKKYWTMIVDDNATNVYQTYAFNKLCYEYRRTSLTNIKKGNIRCCFAVAFRNELPVCIAPLIIDYKPHMRVGLLGTGTNAGTLDFIYNENTDKQEILELYKVCKQRFSMADFLFYFVKETSPLCEEMLEQQVYNNYEVFVEDYINYFASLSKSTRQNIRTAYNRLEKSGLSYSLHIFDRNERNIDNIIEQLNVIYQNRRLIWDENNKMPSEKKMKMIAKRDVVYQSMRKIEGGQIVVLFISGQPAAFFMGFNVGNRFYVPRLAIGAEYEKFSPGMLLINEYLKQVPSNFAFDLGRGDEGYKNKLQGQLYSTKLLGDKGGIK